MKIQKNVSLGKEYSYINIGGTADFLAKIETLDDLIKAVQFAKEKNLPILVVGSGSNIIFSDKGFKGLVLWLECGLVDIKNSDKYSLQKDSLTVSAGLRWFNLTNNLQLDFSEFDMPGTIGGAVVGNAGAHGKSVSDILLSAELFDLQKEKIFKADNKWFKFSYRHSRLKNDKNYIIWAATFKLPKKKSWAEINKKRISFKDERKAKQPSGYSTGSFFKNPQDFPAGKILEEAGCKGLHMGHAKISEKHANWIVHFGGATQKEIITLAKMAKDKVFKKFHIYLEPEVQIIDEFGKMIKI